MYLIGLCSKKSNYVFDIILTGKQAGDVHEVMSQLNVNNQNMFVNCYDTHREE